MTKASDNPFPSLLVQEAATDGSDFANPAADYRRLFLGEDGALHLKDSAGTVTDVSSAGGDVATDAIWDAAGDLVQGTGANTAAKLTLGAAGTVVRSTGSANAYAYPPGYEIDYVEKTSPTAITASTEATANTVVTGAAISYDGSTIVRIEFYAPTGYADNTATADMYVYLFDGSTSLGIIYGMRSESVNRAYQGIYAARRLTPSNASHTYSIRASLSGAGGDGSVGGGTGAAGAESPCFMRITKV